MKRRIFEMQDITILDGGMGRELERLGAPFKQPEWSALALMEAPQTVKEAHSAFINAGAQIITTNSYALVPFHIGDDVFKTRGSELIKGSARLAKEAVAESLQNVQVAGSLPPLFGSYRADLYRAAEVDAIAKPLIEGLNDNIDIWLNETVSLLAESLAIKALVDVIDVDKKPYWVAFTLEDSSGSKVPRLRSGESVEEAVSAMENVNVDAILFNCSQPEVIADALRVAKTTLTGSNIELGAYANAFPPQTKDATANDGLSTVRKDLTPDTYLVWAKKWAELGATLIGGCCGIGPMHIEELSKSFKQGE